MKIVKILGGLGNQMHQYALAISLRHRFPDELVKIDVSCFRGYGAHNGYELDRIFGANIPKASFCDVAKIAWPYMHYRLWQVGKYILPLRKTICMENCRMDYDDSVLSVPGPRYYDGYWQNENYYTEVRDEILRAFSMPELKDDKNVAFMSEMAGRRCASIHIRRGDFLKHKLYRGICDLDYYRKALQLLEAHDIEVFSVFSNDIQWCREHIAPLLPGKQIMYVDWNKGKNSYADMLLMSMHKYSIISNSSFSWWAAWLNTNADKTIISPSRFINKEGYTFPKPKGWIVI